ncbi:hypothetical protein K8I85_03360 [bacterium]|nr:hypothetical protein [bacterium]
MRTRWLLALALLPLAGGARAVTVLEYRGTLQGDPPVVRPVSVSIDPFTMNICVTDEASHCLNVFDAKGFHRFRTDAVSAIRLPAGGVIDPSGDFLFTDTATDEHGEPLRRRTIRRLNFLGEPVDFSPEPPRPDWVPRHLLLARNGDILTIDRSGLLCRHDASGRLLWSTQAAETEWEGVDLLGAPTERADGVILVPGATLGRVIRISADGREKSAFGLRGTKRGELAFPVGVAEGPEGQTLVLDRMRHLILLYDADGEFLNEFCGLGFGPGDLYYPMGIAIAPDGRVFVSQGYEGRVQVFQLFDTAKMTFPESDGR